MALRQISTNSAPAAIGPYSQAVESGNLLFISGQIAINPDTGHISGSTLQEQTHQVMRNIKAILVSQGLQTTSLVKTTVYLRDISLFGEFNAVYLSELDDARPARSVVEVSGLPKNVLVEIEAIACR